MKNERIIFRTQSINPYDVIKEIELCVPETIGKCYYDTDDKILKSNDINYRFHYDPFHSVVMMQKAPFV
jgi:hypothetical protein